LSQESKISLNKIIKRYEKYQEFFYKNSEKEDKNQEIVEEEEEEEIIEWSSERASRRATKRSVMIFNSPPLSQQIPKRIKLGNVDLVAIGEEEGF
jgi:predicted lipase